MRIFFLLTLLFATQTISMAAAPVEIPFGRESALVSTEFTGGVTERRCEARIWRDEANFHVVLRSEHGALAHKANALNGHDDPVFRDDCIEIFLDVEGRGKSYYQVVANVNGAIYDHWRDEYRRSSVRWDSDAVAKGRYGADFYEIEVAIPLASLNLGNNPSGEIALAIGTHVRYNKDNRITWGQYHQPQTWKRFTLSGSYPVALDSWEGSEAAGKQSYTFALKNTSGRDLSLTGTFNGRKIAMELPAGEIRKLTEATVHTTDEPTEHRLLLNDGTREVLHFVRKFTPHPLLYAVPASVLLFKDDPIRIHGSLREEPSEPLEVVLHSPSGSTVKKVPLSGRRFSIDLHDEQADSIDCRYKGESLRFKLERIASPWSPR
ncbi:MAG TPA: hypothetical protein VNQ90_18585 [Chthoniobacteraceae bacterium]|nr:hypothetical protein [Chthoniobacteraceae bacterium]